MPIVARSPSRERPSRRLSTKIDEDEFARAIHRPFASIASIASRARG
jgi:hypothetical protein